MLIALLEQDRHLRFRQNSRSQDALIYLHDMLFQYAEGSFLFFQSGDQVRTSEVKFKVKNIYLILHIEKYSSFMICYK